MVKLRLKNIEQWKLRYKIILGLILVWVSLMLIGYILLRNPLFQEYLKTKLIAELEKNLNAQVSIGDISGNFFSWVRLRHVKVIGPNLAKEPIETDGVQTKPGAMSSQNSFTADMVAVRFSLWEAFSGKLGFANIQLSRHDCPVYRNL